MQEKFNPGDPVWDTAWEPPLAGWIEDIDEDGVWILNTPPGVDIGDAGIGWSADLNTLRPRAVTPQ